MSEFELSLLRQRSHEAREAKARRGELGFRLPVGLCRAPSGEIELDPDRRVQEAIGLVFRKFIEYGSARQVLLWLRAEKLQVPATRLGIHGCETHWRLPTNASVVSILKNPLYAGAYVHGRHETRTVMVDGRARKTANHLKPRERWTVLIRDHHPGYITWEQYERHQAMLAENAHMKQRIGRKAGRGGRALLTGLLRCGRCGRRLLVWYRSSAVRYCCRAGNVNHGLARCLSFGNRQAEAAVTAELLRAVQGSAVDAALAAVEQRGAREAERVRALELELEQARYQARLAARRYEAVDPDNRLVAASLEARWNEALVHVQEVERKLSPSGAGDTAVPDTALLRALANDLQSVWDAPATDMRLKQRIVRTLLEEIVVDVDEAKSELHLVLHWFGGRHTELRVPKKARPRTVTDMRAVEIVRGMAGRFPDEVIASTLNRLGLRTGTGHVWKAHRVQSLRRYHDLPGYDQKNPARSGVLTIQQAARHLDVSPGVVRRLIRIGILKGRQVVALAPWEIDEPELESPAVRAAIARVRGSRPRTSSAPNQLSIIPTE
jgi:hypothetical protein